MDSISGPISSMVHNETFIVYANSSGDMGLISYPEGKTDKRSGVHESPISSLSLSVQNEQLYIISACSEKKIKVWLVNEEEGTFSCVEQYISKHKDILTCCLLFSTFDVDVKLLTGSYDNSVILQSGAINLMKFEGLKTGVLCIDFNNMCIIGCGCDGSICIWSHDGKLLTYISGLEQSSAVLSFYISKITDDEFDVTLAFADIDGSVQIRKPFERSYSCSLEGHRKSITSCCFCSTGEILSSSLDGTINFWRPPLDNETTLSYHTSSITSLVLSMANLCAISSDTHGNVFLWKINSTSTSPMIYAAKKSYIGGYIRSLTWIGEKKIVCAVSQDVDMKEKYFLDIIDINTDENNLSSLQVKRSHQFGSEIICLDTSASGTIVAGFKSGEFVVVTENNEKIVSVSEDWVLGTKIIEANSVEYLFLSLLSGSIRRYDLAELTSLNVPNESSFCKFSPADQSPLYNSAFNCETEERVFCGDTNGYLRIYMKDNCSSIKIHDDTVTGISIIDSYLFTCSLDRTVKGWNISNMKQVCQYHSTIPITCIGADKERNGSLTYLLSIGTTSGATYLLKFYPD